MGLLHKIKHRLRLVPSETRVLPELTEEVAAAPLDEAPTPAAPLLVGENLPIAPVVTSPNLSGRESYVEIRERMVGFLHEQASNMESMSKSVHHIDEKAQDLLLEKQQQRARLGDLVGSAQKAIQDIQAVTQTYNEIRAIKTSIDELLKIEDAVRRNLTEIDSVVLNSKILAFNASLEAGRAGLEGKGFLVVSDKMREFSLEISAIGKTIRGNTERSKDTLSRVTQALDSGFVKMENATRASTQLLELVQKGIVQMDAEFAASLTSWEGHAQAITDLQNQVAATVENSSSASAAMVSFLQDSQIDQLEAQEVWQRLREFDHILDVRRADEFDAELGHIEGAELLTIDDAFADRMALLPRDLNYVFVCRSGGRSARAARMALDMGFHRVTNMVGGMLKWKELELPSVQGKTELPKASSGD